MAAVQWIAAIGALGSADLFDRMAHTGTIMTNGTASFLRTWRSTTWTSGCTKKIPVLELCRWF